MARDDSPVDLALIRAGLLAAEQLNVIRARQAAGDPRSIAELALAAGWIGREQLARSTASSGSSVTAPSGTSSRRLSAGATPQVIGGMRVLRRLGMGGAGAVFEGQTTDGRGVAIKVLMDTEGDALDRFEREQRLLSQLEDRAGFVNILGSGRDPAGPFLVLELMEGGSLSSRLDGEPLDIGEAVKLGRSLARSLGQAHELGIVHRDIKPDNVLFDADGRAKIADLGIGKHFRRDRGANKQSISLTADGEVFGTPSYMAPEQLDDTRSVGPPADVYSLGAVLYEALTGLRLYRGGNAAEVMFQVVKGGWTPVSQLRPDCPTWLVRVVSRCLALDPADRYPNGAALARALAPKRAPAKTGAPRLGPALLVILAILGLVGASVLFQSSESPAPQTPPKDPAGPRPPPVKEPPPAEPPKPESSAYADAWRGEVFALDRVLSESRGKHQSMITDVKLHPDRASLVSVGLESAIRRWALEDGRLLGAIDSGFARVDAVDLSADGRLVMAAGQASASAPGQVKIWELDSGRLLHAVTSPGEARLAPVAFGARAAFAFLGSRGYLIELAGFRETPLSLSNIEGVAHLATIAEADRFLAAGSRGELLLLDAEGAELKRARLSDDLGVEQVLVHDEGRKVLLAERSGFLSEWSIEPELRELRRVRAIRAEDKRYIAGYLRGLDLSEDRRQVYCAGDDFAVLVFDYERFERVGLFRQFENWVQRLAALPAKGGLVLGGNARTLERWSLDGVTKLWGAEGHRGAVMALKVRGDGRRLVSFATDRQLICWDLEDGSEMWRRTLPVSRINAIAFAADGSVAVGASGQAQGRGFGAVLAFAADGTPRASRADGGMPEVSCLAYGADSAALVAGDLGGGVFAPGLWPPPSRRVAHRAPVLAISMINRGLAWRSYHSDGAVLEWSRERAPRSIAAPSSRSIRLLFPRSNDTVIVAEEALGLLSRSLVGGPEQPFEDGEGRPMVGALDPGEERLAVAWADGRLGLWDPDRRELLDKIEPKLVGESIFCLDFEPDGRRLWVGTSRGVILSLRCDKKR